jgi:hypothetical protein
MTQRTRRRTIPAAIIPAPVSGARESDTGASLRIVAGVCSFLLRFDEGAQAIDSGLPLLGNRIQMAALCFAGRKSAT